MQLLQKILTLHIGQSHTLYIAPIPRKSANKLTWTNKHTEASKHTGASKHNMLFAV